MNYRKFSKIWLMCTIVSFTFFCALAYIIDPVEFFGTKKLNGINHYKVKEINYLYTCKPYQVLRMSPEVVFIGTSRIYVGWKPSLAGNNDMSVYNLGCDSLSLKNTEYLLDMVYNNSKPKYVFLGLDFFQFDGNHYYKTREGFSREKAEVLSSKNSVKYNFALLKDVIGTNSTIIDTFKSSYKNENEKVLFIQGWARYRGEFKGTSKKGFYGDLNEYKKLYKNWSYDKEAIKCVERIVNKAKMNNIKLYVFFNPLSQDLRSMIYSLNLNNNMDKIKKEITKINGVVYDFNFSNEITNNRSNYVDASHYNANVGELMKKTILANESNDMCLILTTSNVDKLLEKEEKLYFNWEKKNREYVDELRINMNSDEEIMEEEFNQYFSI